MRKPLLLILLASVLILQNLVPVFAVIDAGAARSVIVYDSTFKEYIFEKEPYKRIFPASITKLMTAILVIENTEDLSLEVTASAKAVSSNRAGGSTTDIKEGEVLTYLQLLDALLIRSGNEVAYILAEAVAGTEEAFVAMMNEKAKYIGLTDTQFKNACGLHEEDHYSTAYDILKLSLYAMKLPLIKEIVSKKTLSLPPTNKHAEEGWADNKNTNRLLNDEKYFSALFSPFGIKTGSTPFAGYCLSSSAFLPEGNELFAVVTGAADENSLYEFNKRLYEEIRTLYEEKTLYDRDTQFAALTVQGKEIPLYSEDPLRVLVPPGFPVSKLVVEVKTDEPLSFPLDAGASAGVIEVSYNGQQLISTALVTRIAVVPETSVSQTEPSETGTSETDAQTGNADEGTLRAEAFLAKILIAAGAFSFMLLIVSAAHGFAADKRKYSRRRKTWQD